MDIDRDGILLFDSRDVGDVIEVGMSEQNFDWLETTFSDKNA